jgi:hypothetical protein
MASRTIQLSLILQKKKLGIPAGDSMYFSITDVVVKGKMAIYAFSIS